MRGALLRCRPASASVPVFYREHLPYFGFATLTTTGYRDIVPLHLVARSLATLEAVIGPALSGHPAGQARGPWSCKDAIPSMNLRNRKDDEQAVRTVDRCDR